MVKIGVIAWVLWMGTMGGGRVSWVPVQTYTDQIHVSAATVCEQHRAAVAQSHPTLHWRCLLEGIQP